MKKLLLFVFHSYAIYGAMAQSNTYFNNGYSFGHYTKNGYNPVKNSEKFGHLIDFTEIGVEHKIKINTRWNACIGANFRIGLVDYFNLYSHINLNDSIYDDSYSYYYFPISFCLNQGIEYNLYKIKNIDFYLGAELSAFSGLCRVKSLNVYIKDPLRKINGLSWNYFKSYLYPGLTFSVKYTKPQKGSILLKTAFEMGNFLVDRKFYDANQSAKTLLAKSTENYSFWQVHISFLYSFDSFKSTHKKKK